MKICFTGDLFLGGDLNGRTANDIIRSDAFCNADIRVTNLEQPISDTEDFAEKCTLYTNSYAVEQLQQLQIGFANLANNHIHDKGLEGIEETIHHLSKGAIFSFGAGKNMERARSSQSISDNMVLLGYCDYDRPYLKQVAVADEYNPGVNPLRLGNILSDLDRLTADQTAIIYLHWGREHVWFPPYENLVLARRLLEHDKVAHVIGMHAHRIQGYLTNGKKRAYMCLGNFLFPNFFIRPPTQVAHDCKAGESFDVTRQYHSVSALTYKKWKSVNRRSLLVTIDTADGVIDHDIVFQRDNEPIVEDCGRIAALAVQALIASMNIIYRAPKPIYVAIERSTRAIQTLFWRTGILAFRLRQEGLRKTLDIALLKIQGRS